MNRPTPSAPSLADADLWHGGFLEAAIVLGPREDHDADERLISALNAVWSSDFTFGPHADRFSFRADSEPITTIGAGTIDLQSPGHLYGWIKLPLGSWSVGGTCVIREEYGDPNLDWLDVYLPLGALAELDGRVGAYPFGDTDACQSWLEPLSARLGELACTVLDAVSGVAAFIGFEVSGTPEADGWDGTVPSERSIGYVASDERGVAEYYGPTEWR
jgi:hypothetical protein